MYDETGSTEENPFDGFENEDIFNQFREAGFGSRNGRRNGGQKTGFEDIFEDLFNFNGGGKTERDVHNNR